MWSYKPPLRDMQFVIEEVLQAPGGWRDIAQFGDLDSHTAQQILEQAGKFASDVLAPINAPADLEGCRWRDGEVATPAGYVQAYRAFVEGGWPALACDPEHGGQGLPHLLNAALYEMLAAANHGWTMYPGLLQGAYECLNAHGSAELKQRYLPKIVSGEWLSTMCLTEPQAGSDLGAVRTKAEPLSPGRSQDSGLPPRGADAVPGDRGPTDKPTDGSWRITGNKIFISGGEHDLSENIVHLVLCRLPDAPPGTKGLSLLLAPKLLPDGSRNAIRCDGIEKKMGIKGSATCAMAFEGATGWLVGQPHRGLAAMFVMMNSARLHVGLQGLGHLEMAAQNALAYAQERVQMRAAARPAGQPAAAADPIVLHPAMRRILWRLKAMVEGERVLAYWIAQLLDDAEHHPDAARRERAEGLVAVLTPVAKAFFTDTGHRGADDALQVWGGYGYVHEYGIEQAVRDSRIAMIYEGTNEIQAIDLLTRKVLDDGGARLGLLLSELDDEAGRCDESVALQPFAEGLRCQRLALHAATRALIEGRQSDPEWPLRIADDYLRGLGLALLAWAWARTARAVVQLERDTWLQAKWDAALFGMRWLLPEADVLWRRVNCRSAELPWITA